MGRIQDDSHSLRSWYRSAARRPWQCRITRLWQRWWASNASRWPTQTRQMQPTLTVKRVALLKAANHSSPNRRCFSNGLRNCAQWKVKLKLTQFAQRRTARFPWTHVRHKSATSMKTIQVDSQMSQQNSHMRGLNDSVRIRRAWPSRRMQKLDAWKTTCQRAKRAFSDSMPRTETSKWVLQMRLCSTSWDGIRSLRRPQTSHWVIWLSQTKREQSGTWSSPKRKFADKRSKRAQICRLVRTGSTSQSRFTVTSLRHRCSHRSIVLRQPRKTALSRTTAARTSCRQTCQPI